MSKQAIKTNNDKKWLQKKISLRLESLPDKKEINILEAFGGDGILWDGVKKLTKSKLTVLSIDKNKYGRKQLQGDNLKFLSSIDLSKFDIIDLDAWGSPFSQLELLFKKKYSGIVHCTYIKSPLAPIPNIVFSSLDISEHIFSKVRTIFKNQYQGLFLGYLFTRNIFKIRGYISVKTQRMVKNYFYFKMGNFEKD